MTRLGLTVLVTSLLLLPGAFSGGGPQRASSLAGADGGDARSTSVRDGARGSDSDDSVDGPRVRGDRAAQRGGEGTAGIPGSSADRSRARSLRGFGGDAIGTIIEVASDVSPEWGAQLRARQSEDPEGLRRSIASNGRRLIALAVLRDQEPDLYRLKVSELRIQAATDAAVAAFRGAVTSGDEREAAVLLEDVRRHARMQIDHDLRTRAEELAALDLQVRRLKDRLAEDSLNRDSRIAELLEALIEGDAASRRLLDSGLDDAGR